MAERKIWMKTPPRAQKPDAAERQEIITACEAFIAGFLKPRFLSEIVPTAMNYPVDIFGAWSGARYRFIRRYRSGWEENAGAEFDAPFARLDRMARDNFDIYWMRHTGQWWRLHQGVTLAKAMEILETDGHLHPV